MEATMRGLGERNEALFSYVNLEERVPARHPLRMIRGPTNWMSKTAGETKA